MKNTWKCLLLIAINVIMKQSVLTAQNLVQNGSFEQYNFCPSSSNHVDDCIGWQHVLNSPDYYNVCALYPVGVPSNFFGNQMPYDGNGYMGLHTYVVFSTDYREIIGAQLLDTLIPGFTYHVSFRVSRGNWTSDVNNQTATDKMGIRFATFEHTISNPPAINNFAQLFEDTVITDTLNWTPLAWDYIPDSSYTHLYIGNFFDDLHTDTVNIGWIFGKAGYYIDSVKIVCTNCITGIEENPNDVNGITYNSLTGTMSIRHYHKAEVSIFNNLGQMVYRKVIDGSLSQNLKLYGSGMFIVIIDDGKNITSKKIINQ